MDNVVFMYVHENTNDTCFNDLLKNKYGDINAEWIVNTLAPSFWTGDTQLAAYNFNKQELLLQVSLNKKLAFQRPMIRIKLEKIFSD